MKHKLQTLGCTFMLFALLATSIYGQDVLYLKDGNRVECEIQSVEETRVRYTAAGQPLTAPTNRLLMLFHDNGSYQVFDPGMEQGYRAFVGNSTYDHILTYDNKLEVINIVSQTNESIKYQKAGQSDGPTYTRELFNLLLIVYKNGRHEMFGDYEEVAEALLLVSPRDAKNLAQYASPVEETVSSELPDSPTPTESTPSQPQETWNLSEEPESPVATEPEPEPEIVLPPNPEAEAMEVNPEEFSRKALDKTETLGTYFAIIADKETPWQDANQAIDLAIQLFLSEDAQVEVSSVNAVQKKSYPIRVYLERLKLLKYDQVEIEWSNISYVSKLRKAPDGNYYGVISFVQKFTGYRDGQIAYTDLTRKNIEVVLKGYEKEVAGETVELWDVFLSDIGVINTRRG